MFVGYLAFTFIGRFKSDVSMENILGTPVYKAASNKTFNMMRWQYFQLKSYVVTKAFNNIPPRLVRDHITLCTWKDWLVHRDVCRRPVSEQGGQDGSHNNYPANTRHDSMLGQCWAGVADGGPQCLVFTRHYYLWDQTEKIELLSLYKLIAPYLSIPRPRFIWPVHHLNRNGRWFYTDCHYH